MEQIKEKLARLTTEPGVYLMKDASCKVLYVGKANNLRSRVRSYFQNAADLHPRTRQMVGEVADFDFMVVNSESEALLLEHSLIQQHKPYYNVRFRDDKRYPFIRIPVKDPYPPVMVVRRRADDGARYFGPYISSRNMRETIRLIRRLFGLRFVRQDAKRTCSGHHWDPAGPKRLRACLDFHIGLCLGPCAAGNTTDEEYGAAVRQAVKFLEGHTDELLRGMRREMEAASAALDFETAARLRDSIAAVEQISESQQVVLEKREDLDAVALAMRQDTACVAAFQVREGRIVGQSRFFLEGITGLEEAQVLNEFVKSQYLAGDEMPPQILLACEIEEREAIEALLAEKSGRKIKLLVPQRGDRRKLVELAAKNAAQHLKDALEKESMSDKKAQEALLELRETLGLPSVPNRIECFDISNLFGANAVGSMVVFQGGKPYKNDYRRFKIRAKEAQPDDFAMMREVIKRRLQAGLEGSERFREWPDLILVDGGKGQLNVALGALREAGVQIPAVGLAKEFEHLFAEGRAEPIVLPRHSRSLHLLQAIRDEAHRFAIAYHRSLKRGEAAASILRTIPGVGEGRQKALLRQFPSLNALRQATIEEIAAVPGISRNLAEVILTNLRAEAPKDD